LDDDRIDGGLILDSKPVSSEEERMRIDCKILNARIRAFLKSPDAKPVWDELTNSVLFNVVASFFMAMIGLILLCTIVLTKVGFEMLKGILLSFVTLEVFRDPKKELQAHPERLQPLVLASVIAAPNGHGLMLGSLSARTQSNGDFLARKAGELADIYTEGSSEDEDEITKLLRDDVYVPNRRRQVPASHSEGHDLLLFDMEFDAENIHFSPDETGWVAAVATVKQDEEAGPPRGCVVQIPWRVVAAAVSA
jgi:hypothetical protein